MNKRSTCFTCDPQPVAFSGVENVGRHCCTRCGKAFRLEVEPVDYYVKFGLPSSGGPTFITRMVPL